jgi:DNA-binding transcriptional LysR family regulator
LNLLCVGIPATPVGSPTRAAKRLLISQSAVADMLTGGLNSIGERSLRVVTRDAEPISRAAAFPRQARAMLDGLWDDSGAVPLLFVGPWGYTE